MVPINDRKSTDSKCRERRNLIIIALVSTILGAIVLYLQFNIEAAILRVVFYLTAALLISNGITVFVYLIESSVRENAAEKSKFSESVWWLSLCTFAFCQYLTLDTPLYKSLYGLLAVACLVAFLIFFGKAMYNTAFGKKNVHPAVAFAALFAIMVAMAFLIESLDTLMFYLPLTLILLYSTYILLQFLLINNTEEFDRCEPVDRGNMLEGFRIIIGDPNKYLRRSFLWTMLLILVIQSLSIFFIKVNRALPDIIVNLPQISLAIYVTLLSIITGFSVIYVRKSDQESGGMFRKPVLGLAQMCIVFSII